ncbi:MAG: S8 family peptidase [Pseudomonadota bacterium]
MASTSKKLAPVDGSEPELIAVAKPGAVLRAENESVRSEAGLPTAGVEKKLSKYNALLRPLFGPTEERVDAMVLGQEAVASAPLVQLSNFYRVDAAPKDLEKIQKDMLDEDLFEGVYIKPPVEPADEINLMEAMPDAPPSSTADFSGRQIYLNPAPEGIDAKWAWTQSGGRGHGVNIIDIEGAWRFTHEDLMQRQGGVVGGNVIDGVRWRNHGTAVLGVYGADINGFGVQGICSDAITSAVSHGGIGSASAINTAASRLRAGDIMLLEMHRPGPRHDFTFRNDQRGYVAIEWWPDDFAAILNACRKGIIVVEAAGNGAEDLDDDLYETPGFGFPASWSNSYRRQNRDSGAVVVGAGAPPPGTHGRDHGPDRSRLGFSNYGAIVDAQGWGREVTSCGYGDLQGGTNEDLWYTDRFSGTSSASPIVVGAIGSLQGMAKARGRAVFSPGEIRQALRTTGSPQQSAPSRPKSQRIGNRPNMRELAQTLFPTGGDKRSIAFRREIEAWRPLEVRAFIDISPELVDDYSTTVLQGALASAQALTDGAFDLEDLAILFRLSAMEGQSVVIAGPVGGGRYRYWVGVAADGLSTVFVDKGFSSTGSRVFDIVADIAGEEVRLAFNETLQQFQEV